VSLVRNLAAVIVVVVDGLLALLTPRPEEVPPRG